MFAPVSDAERQRLREAAPEVLAVLYGVTDLRRPFRCPDPRHEDRNPSTSYDHHRHAVHCFSCGGDWDAFDLVGMHDGIDGFVDQAHRVAEIVGIALIGDGEFITQSRKGRRGIAGREAATAPVVTPALPDIFDRCRNACLGIYRGQDGGARDLLLARGFDDIDIMKHGLGYMAEPKAIMEQFNVWEPDAAGFVVIPYFDKERASIHYATLRTIEGDAPCKHKEWRPRGVPVPLWQEWLLVDGLPVVYVTEGVFDAIAFEKMFARPCVALGGTSFTNRLINILKDCEPDARPGKVMLLMDNDEAGKRAAKNLAAKLDVLGIPHATAADVLGECKDANDMLMSLRGSKWEFAQAASDAFPGVRMVETRWL